MSSNETRDLKRLKVLGAIMNRVESTEKEKLEAAFEIVDITARYDALSVQRFARLHTLDALKALQELAAKHPTSAEEKKVQEEAKQKLAYYEKLLFPPEKLPN